MKRMLSLLAALMVVFYGASALALQGCLVDEAPYTNHYGCATTPEGNIIVALGLRYTENSSEGEHPQSARLACLNADGNLLWENVEKEANSLYADPCVLADGSILALYYVRTGSETDSQHTLIFLRSFSPMGELTGEIKLPEGSENFLQTGAGLMVSIVDRNGEKPYPRRAELYDGTLTPVLTLENLSLRFRYDSMITDAQGAVLLYRITDLKAAQPLDQVRLMQVRPDGQEAWSLVLAEQQMGYMALQTNSDGQIIVFINGWLENGRGQSVDGTLTCLAPDGKLVWQKPVSFPEKSGEFELAGFRVLTDGYLFMGLAKTNTCVRLYRFDTNGVFAGSTDNLLEEEANYTLPSLAGTPDRLCTLVTQRDGDRSALWMMPLTMP